VECRSLSIFWAIHLVRLSTGVTKKYRCTVRWLLAATCDPRPPELQITCTQFICLVTTLFLKIAAESYSWNPRESQLLVSCIKCPRNVKFPRHSTIHILKKDFTHACDVGADTKSRAINDRTENTNFCLWRHDSGVPQWLQFVCRLILATYWSKWVPVGTIMSKVCAAGCWHGSGNSCLCSVSLAARTGNMNYMNACDVIDRLVTSA